MQPQLIIENISISYNHQAIIDNCAFSLSRAKILSLLGASGCGKSTLLKGIAGLLPIDSGRIILNNRVISSPHCHINPEQRGVGMIFQDYALFPHLTVFDNVAFGLHKLPKSEQKKICIEWLEIVRLTEFAKRYPHELSGGQQQRVAIARTLVCKPQIILFDEPFSNLDASVRQTLMADIKNLLKSQEITAIFVTHDKNEAFAMADDIAVIQKGMIAQLGNPQQLYDNPIDQNIAEFLGNSTLLHAKKSGDNWLTPMGTVSHHDKDKVIFWQKNNDDADIFLRSHQILLTPNAQGKARIENKSFRGDLNFYTIRIDKDLINIVTQQRFNIGDRIDSKISLN